VLQSYDAAFGKFFARLAADGITKDNTLFVVTADENDHFVGGPPSPPNCDGVTTPCTYANIGEITTYIDRLLLTQRMNSTPFSVHSDSAPTFYVTGNPAPTDSSTRTLEHDVAALVAANPITGASDTLSVFLADQAVMNLLHMVTSVPDRTPTFTIRQSRLLQPGRKWGPRARERLFARTGMCLRIPGIRLEPW
jgi:hypothetical protein